jgi:hypothetical protein
MYAIHFAHMPIISARGPGIQSAILPPFYDKKVIENNPLSRAGTIETMTDTSDAAANEPEAAAFKSEAAANESDAATVEPEYALYVVYGGKTTLYMGGVNE